MRAVYSSVRFIENQVHGVTGSKIGAYMIVPGVGFESSSGGPFFRYVLCLVHRILIDEANVGHRDINFQGGQ